MRSIASLALTLAASASAFAVIGCTQGVRPIYGVDAGMSPFVDGAFVCISETAQACVGTIHHSCERDGEFLRVVRDDCASRGLICTDGLWCTLCIPRSLGCSPEGHAVRCNETGDAWELVDECDVANGEVCDIGTCRNLCQVALERRSYLGCEFYGVDLDNAAIGAGRDASSQQYAIVVSNPGAYPTEVVAELDTGVFGGTTQVRELYRRLVLPGDLEVFPLPRREVDGSSFMTPCDSDAACLSATQQCFCAGGATPGPGTRDCRCRSGPLAPGLNDGTHSAQTAHAFRLRSVLPIIAYQFNPLDNVGVFSNDASLLLPTSAIGTRYTVVGWPQTIADSDVPAHDFDPTSDDEDLRATLTVVGTAEGTHVTITLGPQVGQVVGIGGGRFYGPGETIEVDLGAFDVINLETQAFNGDFTGTLVVSNGDHPVTVFVGSEASDAPRFDDLANRRCCADHLEEQLFPDDTLGRRFFIGRTPTRSGALNRAFITPDSVGDFNEPEYVRIVAVEPGFTHVTTTLPPESFDDAFDLAQGESRVLVATQDIEINSDRAIAVLQVIGSQEATGIPNEFPGGDPAILVVPPVDQYRRDYVFLTPDLYAFDFVTIVAPADAVILLDEAPLPTTCQVGAADGIPRRMDDPPPTWLVYRCQLSFPDVLGPPNVRVEDGMQDDGYHTVRATQEVSVVITGFAAFVSYAFVGGADLDALM